MATHSNILALKNKQTKKSHGQRSLAGYNLWGHKESDMTEHTHILADSYSLKHFFHSCMVCHCIHTGQFINSFLLLLGS